jgi:hypothetical protein
MDAIAKGYLKSMAFLIFLVCSPAVDLHRSDLA